MVVVIVVVGCGGAVDAVILFVVAVAFAVIIATMLAAGAVGDGIYSILGPTSHLWYLKHLVADIFDSLCTVL